MSPSSLTLSASSGSTRKYLIIGPRIMQVANDQNLSPFCEHSRSTNANELSKLAESNTLKLNNSLACGK